MLSEHLELASHTTHFNCQGASFLVKTNGLVHFIVGWKIPIPILLSIYRVLFGGRRASRCFGDAPIAGFLSACTTVARTKHQDKGLLSVSCCSVKDEGGSSSPLRGSNWAAAASLSQVTAEKSDCFVLLFLSIFRL